MSEETLAIRTWNEGGSPVLVYLPGLHGDWTLVAPFRTALGTDLGFVEFTYPRTTTWTLTDYARGIAESLRERGLTHAWLLAESFGSQVAWAMLEDPGLFAIDGLILAGGFVNHPGPWLVRLGRRFTPAASLQNLRRFFLGYAAYARLRHGNTPLIRASMEEFLARRTEADRRAMVHRLQLIAEADWRSVARRVRQPVYYLTGGVDLIVPWPPVWRWLRRHCPGFHGTKILAHADHTVLATAPRTAAGVVRRWLERPGSPARPEPGPGVSPVR